MRINLQVDYADGNVQEVICSAPDLVKFEEKFDLSIAKLGQEMKVTHLLFLAYSSLSRRGEVKLPFEKWLENVANIGAADSDPK